MNKEKLFGLKPNFLTVAYSQLIKSAIFLRYGIKSDEKIFLSSKPSPILGVGRGEAVWRGACGAGGAAGGGAGGRPGGGVRDWGR